MDIITASHPNPNPSWLGYVKTGKARAQIRHFLKNMQVEESAQLGERLLTQALRQFGVTPDEIGDASWAQWLESAELKSRKEALADVGQGKSSATYVARSLLKLENARGAGRPPEKPESALLIRGAEGMAVQIARCCQPIPGDPIVGHERLAQLNEFPNKARVLLSPVGAGAEFVEDRTKRFRLLRVLSLEVCVSSIQRSSHAPDSSLLF